MQKVGKVAYKLALPATSQIHPVVHVSQLKKAVGVSTQVEAVLPDVPPDETKPEQILGTYGARLMAQLTVRFWCDGMGFQTL